MTRDKHQPIQVRALAVVHRLNAIICRSTEFPEAIPPMLKNFPSNKLLPLLRIDMFTPCGGKVVKCLSSILF